MSEKFSPKFMAGVQLMSALMGMTLAFKERFGEEATKVAQGVAVQTGTMMGSRLKKEAGITGTGLHDIERLYHAWLDPILAPHILKTNVEGKKLTITREGPTMCPALVVAKQMNVPLQTICNTISMRMFEGIAKSVNPNAEHSSVHLSENKCIEMIRIP